MIPAIPPAASGHTLDDVAELAARVMPAAAVPAWLALPNRHLDMRSPRLMVRSGHTHRVLDLLDALAQDSGVTLDDGSSSTPAAATH